MKTLVVIGAGFSGAAFAAQFLRHCPPSADGVRLVLVNRSGDMARGLAYGTHSARHLLNVPAGNMSALAEDADDFLNFCRARHPEVAAGSFVSRQLYGEYLLDLLERAEAGRASGIELQRRVDEVQALRPDAEGVNVELKSGDRLRADHVVLAFGHFAPLTPAVLSTALGSERYSADPWSAGALSAIPDEARVLLLGSGLTALDVVLDLLHRGHRGEIVMLSRRGLLPLAHRPQRGAVDVAGGLCERLLQLPPTTRALVRAVRCEARECMARGGDWRDVLAALRPITPQLWQRLPALERSRFLRHVQPYWDVHRHRVAAASHRIFQQALADGRLRLIAGRLAGVREQADGLSLEVRLRHSGDVQHLQVARAINCTGPNANLARVDDPFIGDLLAQGLVCADAHGLGLHVADNLALETRSGAAAERLSYIGPMLKADLWEATAVPELRQHASRLARRLCDLMG